jgi:hypothetical protein
MWPVTAMCCSVCVYGSQCSGMIKFGCMVCTCTELSSLDKIKILFHAGKLLENRKSKYFVFFLSSQTMLTS